MVKTITTEDLQNYVKENIGIFHENRIEKLKNLSLDTLLKKKNPYLFKAKNLTDAHDLVKSLLDAHLSSRDEGVFGIFLEGLAIFVNKKTHGGWKSSAEGIDLEFEKGGIRYIVSIKSGPNWGNSSQVKKMKDNFIQAKRILRQTNQGLNVQPVNGCCYGIDNNPDKDIYYKYCGQKFWTFISGNENLYKEIVKPLGYKAKQKNEKFMQNYERVVNQFTLSFMQRFCEDGVIQWKELMRFNSAEKSTGRSGKNNPDFIPR